MEYTHTVSFGNITSKTNDPFKEIWKIMIFGGGHLGFLKILNSYHLF